LEFGSWISFEIRSVGSEGYALVAVGFREGISPENSFRMKAVILAAGKGTRMKELTNELPKPMLKVQGKPILEHIIEGLLLAGVHDIFIVTGFRAEVIEDYFGDGSKWNARIVYGRQETQDGTGKAPEVARDFVGASPFILTYGDILVPPETYQRMIHRYNEGYFSGVITITPGQDVTQGPAPRQANSGRLRENRKAVHLWTAFPLTHLGHKPRTTG